jgi:hypothetical protein
MPFEVSDLVLAGSVVVGLVALCWIVAKMLDRRGDVLRHIERDHSEP